MKLLLDTCAFLWFNLDSPRLSKTARELLADPQNDLFLSAISVWEIAVKYRSGRLSLPEPPALFVATSRRRYDIAPLEFREEAAFQLAKLPNLHADPFDRMLICQCIAHGLPILTPDEWIARYPVRVLW